ncbi:TlpA disulfide reductase family protein [Leptospira noguchii]|uniref:TlpA family protein disulfide reductase n=1 Tax=Leptospira noguchii TaxID=28182 RepID=A0A9Q8RI38_9LEPT|nr:TlpA disulfide reductase family protein [Leptospira noguchii]TQE76153.1 TlpA family protein disulfide reductase [Leptospira noguchii]UOG35524.1 TlpA family protein disulfide reductase [Leptospira noguchii]UOG46448.1 TlpA family protein disulfide reductase [Leptospira noguchii]UOG51293.1 TlpA family protein disulfide reductase [Leptospira noguchii]UOG58011.1 TlpA family protein disulfide reductase [Leptospira noguchii]
MNLEFNSFICNVIHRFFLYFIFSLSGFYCALSEQSNLGIQEFQGITLDGQPVRLSEVKASRLILNVYGPNCVPCIKEIPALNYLYQEMQKDPKVQFYMAVDPSLFFDNSEVMSEDEMLTKVIPLVKDEIQRYKIQVPILLMKKPFQVSRTNSIITGTPETLLFKTKPFILYYNFIGPISEEENPQRLIVDQKILFFKRMAGSS